MNATSLWPDPAALGTVTDLYELTMMAAYHAAGISSKPAVFEIFVRKLPPGRSYLVFAGLEQVVTDILNLAFSPSQIAALRALPVFAHLKSGWFDHLAKLRFTGDIWSIPEGTIVFAGEPLVRISAPLEQGQWLETLLLTSLGYPTLVASKAARIVQAAAGRPVFDFGARRGHGPHSGMLSARAAYLAGFAGTSHVEAALRLKIPAVGTMAHAWVQAFDQELDAFRAFAKVYPDEPTLLIDTYDVSSGARHAAMIEPAAAAVRIDSGDLNIESRKARTILDEMGRTATKIVVSGDLEEHAIAMLVEQGAPIDAFGVGTELITSRDAPAISMVDKLVEFEGSGRIKLSVGKKTYPLGKQVSRRLNAEGKFAGDHVTRFDEPIVERPLMLPVVESGYVLQDWPSIESIRAHCKAQSEGLPESLRSLDTTGRYPVTYSDALEAEAERLMARSS